MRKIYLLLMPIFIAMASAQNINITNAEYFFDTDPGAGNGTAITLTDVNTDSAYASFAAPDAGTLSAGLHRWFLRYQSSEGVWSRPEGRYFYLLVPLTSTYQPVNITQGEYYFDTNPGPGNGTPITLTGVGTDSAYAAFIAPEAGQLTPGLHKLYLRYRSDEGPWSGSEGRYFFLFVPWTSDYQPLVVTQAEYYFDNLTPVVVDLTDSTNVSLSQLVSTESLDFGVHRFFVRYRDNRGLASGSEGRYGYIVSPPPTPFVSNHLTGGEYWVNVDPGIGNGIPFGPADDGTWDEGDEATTFELTGLPLGTHYIGLRFRDAFGVWTPTIQDTMAVGPVLMIHRSGNSIVLDWIPSSETEGRPFHIWRALQSDGPFSELDTTSNVTWTDVDILNNPDKHFYHIRQTIPAP